MKNNGLTADLFIHDPISEKGGRSPPFPSSYATVWNAQYT